MEYLPAAPRSHLKASHRRLGLSVSEDVSIVGFDDFSLAVATEVKLTSVNHPKMEMGIEAAKWIVSAVENKNNRRPSIVYEPELVVRNSTAPFVKVQS
ncbi:substrate-binding domain-containing protein [Neobacillus drentensis]|uniref:substrate-binding domain-containing protein n=1 Tax=Neobacillus drentensis TaxID=220684 RepID=UPI002FFFC34C